MEMDARRNRDYSKGPVWDAARNRWLVEIRYPDGSRFRKRLRREREALRLWATAQTKLEDGTWDQRALRNVSVATALEQYRAYSKVQHRSHDSYIDPSLTLWEAHLGPQTHLAKVGSQQVEDFKLKRAQKVARSTTDKDLAILKAFFNWCIAHQLAVSNPVRRVKLFHEDNSRLRYLTREEYDRLIEAVRTLARVAGQHTLALPEETNRPGGLHGPAARQPLQSAFGNRPTRQQRAADPRTKSGRPLSHPLNDTAAGRRSSYLRDARGARPPKSSLTGPDEDGEPVQDIKNGFHAALELAGIEDFTWHDLRHTFASWLMMRGAFHQERRNWLLRLDSNQQPSG